MLDSNGVVVDNKSYSFAERPQVIAQINEHYGTSFTGWSDNEIYMAYGNTLPNWSAYEKIEMPKSQYFKIQFESGYVPVKVLDDAFGIYVYRETTNLIVCDNDGAAIESDGISTSNFVENYIPRINNIIGKDLSAVQTLIDTFLADDSLIALSEEEMEVGYWSIEQWQNAEVIS